MTKKVYLVYYSKTGNTKQIADKILEIFSQTTNAIAIKLMDATNLDLEALKNANGYIIGTPNYFSLPSGFIKIFFDELFEERNNLKGRPIFCYVSHMGSGAIKELDTLCNWLELKIVGDIIAVSGKNISSKVVSSIEVNIKKMIEILS